MVDLKGDDQGHEAAYWLPMDDEWMEANGEELTNDLRASVSRFLIPITG